jgi:peptide chain release factor-like protein
MTATRTQWTDLTDSQLLKQCEVDTYRASGPGGQKRNKTSSAVRLRHSPSGLLVIAEESRSQHENKARALRRLRRRLYLKLREPFAPRDDQLHTIVGLRLKIGTKDERFWPTVGLMLDALAEHCGRVSDAAAAVGVTTGCLVDFLSSEDTVWQQANELRREYGEKPLRLLT